ncbi:MAG: glycoside hydrolase family 27 protein, partial [Opitutaceae bacterium]
TPPMGWNDWYGFTERITGKIIREAADNMVSNGMADVGYQYVDIDDCWANSVREKIPGRDGPPRDGKGNILPNSFFPDMKALTDYIHARGLKAGIYSSPGPWTCAGFTGSYEHEEQDARQFAAWGFDFLKYDWCSYNGIVKGDTSLAARQKPYRLMGGLLKQMPRDVVFNLCQYGAANVWEWGAEVGGNSWRTGGDLIGELNQFFEVALKNAAHGAWSKPGAWNDPDYLAIGTIVSLHGSGGLQPCPLTPTEQYAYMSLWSLMAAPLFYSGDITRLDPFTLNVLCNPEVIDVDQDPLGKCARVVPLTSETFLMIKPLEDGSHAVGLCNRGEISAEVTAKWAELGLAGRQTVRDLWRERDLGVFANEFKAKIPRHGVMLLKLTAAGG